MIKTRLQCGPYFKVKFKTKIGYCGSNIHCQEVRVRNQPYGSKPDVQAVTAKHPGRPRISPKLQDSLPENRKFYKRCWQSQRSCNKVPNVTFDCIGTDIQFSFI
ncbi:hypothetical protein XENORESO_021990 [Xenotaenia resolanae]|uniref:Uncharacterized protein n=1 Tax=Xenotaenia resolanae TaxID=208358 RepID=A0ABV0X1K1_9TELE